MSGALHVIDAVGRASQPAGLHVIAQAMRGSDDRALLLGGRALAEAAIAAGMIGWQRVAPTWGDLPLRRTLRERTPVGTCHCWSPGAAKRMARLMHGGVGRAVERQLGPSLSRDRAMLVTDREVIRRAWRAGEGERFVALLSDHPAEGDAYDAAMIVGLCREALRSREPEVEVRLVLHPDQRHQSAAQRMLANFDLPAGVVQDPRLATPWAVVAGCDATLVLGETAGLAAAWALDAGVPVVAEQHPAVEALASHGGNAAIALSRPGDLRTLSHLLTEALGAPAPVPAAV